MSSSLSPPKAVPYFLYPLSTPAFPEINSIIFPTVILDGNPWGFIIMSGHHPLSLKGISIYGTMIPTTPFWPCLELNLSPISGILICQAINFTLNRSSSVWLTTILSAYEGNSPLYFAGLSIYSSWIRTSLATYLFIYTSPFSILDPTHKIPSFSRFYLILSCSGRFSFFLIIGG